MTQNLRPRLQSFALAAAVTGLLLAGIDTLALQQHASALQMAKAGSAAAVAAPAQAARS
jgi:hypothetical protein